MESSELFRKWTAISTIAAALEQRVVLRTRKGLLYPNLYTILVAAPGVGKTTTVTKARELLVKLENLHIAPTSMTGAALIRTLLEAKKTLPPNMVTNQPPIEYYSMLLLPDELGAFIHTFKENDLIPILTTLYDVVVPYERARMQKDERTTIPRPQLNIIGGSTASNLINLVPAIAWTQGLTSRFIFIYSNEFSVLDDFDFTGEVSEEKLVHDLQLIYSLQGQYQVTPEFRELAAKWRASGEPGRLGHPKLLHYNTRRRAHLYKLSMVSAVDRGNDLVLTGDDFRTALGWLTQAEEVMPNIFIEGNVSQDTQAMDEITEFVKGYVNGGKGGVPEHRVVRFIASIVPPHNVLRVLELMLRAGKLKGNPETKMIYPGD